MSRRRTASTAEKLASARRALARLEARPNANAIQIAALKAMIQRYEKQGKAP